MRCRLFAVFPPHQIYTHFSIVSRKVSSAPISRGCNHSPAIQFNWHIAGSEIVRKWAPTPLERRHKLLSLNWYLSLSVECMSGPSGPLSVSLPPPLSPSLVSLHLFAILYFTPGKQSPSHSPVVKVKLWRFLSMTKYLPCPRRAARKKKIISICMKLFA